MRSCTFIIHRSLLALALLVACDDGARPQESTPGSTGPTSAATGATGPTSATTGPTSATTAPTYYAEVAPLIHRACAGCHRENGIGKFSLLDASTAAQMAPLLAAATAARSMPPMPVNNDGSCNTFKNARWLSDAEIALFQRWAGSGAALGDPADAPPPPADSSPEITGEVTSFDLGVDYSPRPGADQADDYHCFIADPQIASDTFVTGYDIRPEDARLVHHVAMFALANAEAEAEAEALDAKEEGPGYSCYGAPGVTAVSLLGAWTPGSGPTLLPTGTGMRYSGGRKLLLQMHYYVPPTGGPFTDRSTVTFQLSRDEALKPARFLPIGTQEISLPPGEERAQAVGRDVPLSALAQRFNLPPFTRITVWGVFPHMHTAGRTLRAVATAPGEPEKCLTEVDRWDFHWQNLWWNETTIDVTADSTIRVSCGYDTRGRAQTTVAGEGTNDEMCFNALYVTLH